MDVLHAPAIGVVTGAWRLRGVAEGLLTKRTEPLRLGLPEWRRDARSYEAHTGCAYCVPTADSRNWDIPCKCLKINGRDGRIRTGDPLTPSQVR